MVVLCGGFADEVPAKRRIKMLVLNLPVIP